MPAHQQRAERPWYTIRAEDDGRDPEIFIYDRIGEGFFDEGLTAKMLVAELRGIDAARLDVRINSPGGSVFDGLAIYNALVAHPATITTYIDGIAASIASVIALAGAEVVMAPNALFMIHSPMAFADGDADELRRVATVLDAVQDSMITTYRDHCAMTDDELEAALAAETWYSAEDALEVGFATRIADQAVKAAASFDLSMYRNAIPREEPMPTPTAVPDATPPPTYATRSDLEALEARISAPPASPPRYLGVVEAFVEQLRASASTRQIRGALADVINTGNAGVLPPQWSSEVRNYVDSLRYMIPQAGSIAFPSAGYTLTIPKVLTHTLVGPRGAQKSEIPSRALTTGSDTYTATWYAGGVDVALELIWQSDPSVWEIVVQDLLWAYADTTDKAFTLAVESAGQATGAGIVWTDWGTVVGSVLPEAEEIRVATGQPGDKLSLTSASWGKLIGLMDTQGRRILAPGGQMNADGSAALLDRSVNLGGILAFHNPRAVEDVLFNQVSVRVAEKPPVTLTQDNVAQAGRDVAVIGAMLDVLYPTGIKTFSATE